MAPSKRQILLLDSPHMKLALIRRIRRKRSGVSEIYKERHLHGEFHHLYGQLRRSATKFFEYTRMTVDTFDYLISGLRRTIKYETTSFQQPISLEERLIIALWFYATGVSFCQLSFSFRVGKTTVANIVNEISKALWICFQPVHMAAPTTESFLETAKEFWETWKFPNCIGSIDGKHIRILNPPHSGSQYYNYKNYFSIVLLAVTDAKYRFSMIDVGAYGKDSDAGVFNNCSFYKNIEAKQLVLPGDSVLPNSDVVVPHVFIGDEAFPLRTYLMRPYPGRNITPGITVFNQKLSSTRKVVECSFGILAAKWRILLKAIETDVENAVAIVKATAILHNVIIDREGAGISLPLTDGQLRMGGNLHPSVRHNSSQREAVNVRERFCLYFNQ